MIYFISGSTLLILFVMVFVFCWGIFDALKGIIPFIAALILISEAIYGGVRFVQAYKGRVNVLSLVLKALSTLYVMFISYLMWFVGGLGNVDNPLDFIFAILGFIILMGPFCFVIAHWLGILGKWRKNMGVYKALDFWRNNNIFVFTNDVE